VGFQDEPAVEIRVSGCTLFGGGAAARAVDDVLAAGVSSVRSRSTGSNRPVRGRRRCGFALDGAFDAHGKDESVPLLVHDRPATARGFHARSACGFFAILPEIEEAAQLAVPRSQHEAPGETVLPQIRWQGRTPLPR